METQENPKNILLYQMDGKENLQETPGKICKNPAFFLS